MRMNPGIGNPEADEQLRRKPGPDGTFSGIFRDHGPFSPDGRC
jgi:hypothetical protein